MEECAVSAKLIPLEVWATQIYGEHAPGIGTLRRWARDSMITPPAEKHGRVYMVTPDARYSPAAPRQRLVNRIPRNVSAPKKCA